MSFFSVKGDVLAQRPERDGFDGMRASPLSSQPGAERSRPHCPGRHSLAPLDVGHEQTRVALWMAKDHHGCVENLWRHGGSLKPIDQFGLVQFFGEADTVSVIETRRHKIGDLTFVQLVQRRLTSSRPDPPTSRSREVGRLRWSRASAAAAPHGPRPAPRSPWRRGRPRRSRLRRGGRRRTRSRGLGGEESVEKIGEDHGAIGSHGLERKRSGKLFFFFLLLGGVLKKKGRDEDDEDKMGMIGDKSIHA